jgi:hypothetical protein
MSIKLEQMFVSGSILNELRQEIKRISSRFNKYLRAKAQRQMICDQEGRDKTWDYPEAQYQDLNVMRIYYTHIDGIDSGKPLKIL